MARPKRVGRGLPDTGLSDDELPDRDLVERIWRVLQRWAVPVMMSLAYLFLAATSETNTTGKLWMGAGLVLVFVVWFLFRRMAETAGMARAVSVGDVVRLDELAARGPVGRRRVARALAQLLRGELAAALAALDPAGGPGAPDAEPVAAELAAVAQVVRVVALVELARPAAEARRFVAATPRSPAHGWLAEAVVAWRADQPADAARRLAQVIDDIRAGSMVRAIAHIYTARIADARGEPAVAAQHRAKAAAMAVPEASWLRPAAGAASI